MTSIEKAIKLSEIESAKDNPLDERISAIALEKQQDAQADMPTVLSRSAAEEFGWFAKFAEEIAEETTMPGLMERASETSEDIQERREVSDAIIL